MPRGSRGANREEEVPMDVSVPEDIPAAATEECDDDEDEEGGIRIGDIYLPPPPPPACTFESDGPRLIITHIVNENFKSYLGRQVLGPFHKSFTSIIGPNGSGKSNVIDSMLFVFGYRAQKIRSKKISVLIHNSDGHVNVNSCSVAVHFQKIIDKGNDSFDVVPNSQLVVARTAFKDNSSFYTIDGSRAKFKKVARLLRTQGIDLDHNRFLILQGEVEQISLMKPKAQNEHESGMLEYLEDIVGSSRYKEPIELLNSRVDELNELRTEKLNRVKMVEKEKEELAGPKNEALAYIRMENELTLLRNSSLQKKIYDCSQSAEAAEVKRKDIDDSMSDIKRKLADAMERHQTKDAEMKEVNKDLVVASKENERVNELFKQQGAQDVKIGEDLKQIKEKDKKNKKSLHAEKEKLSELESVPERNAAEIAVLTERRDELAASRQLQEEHYQQVMAGIKSETQQFQDEKDQLEGRLTGLKEVVNATKSTMDSVRCELDIYVGNEQSEKAKLVQMETSLETVQQQMQEKQRLTGELESSVPRQRQLLDEASQQLREVSAELLATEQRLRGGRGRLDEARSALQSSRGRGVVLSAVMEQKQNGSLPGVYGRLGDLGAIDDKYDVAVSTACAALDNIVVDTVDTAQRCINFLKRNNVGTATFIALDKMEKWRQHTRSRIQTPEDVPRLFDLIHVEDEAVRTAFYFALRDTLVGDDLTQATRIGYGRQRHRVVTLRGDLIEPSGTMSGGGKRVMCGRMGSRVTPVRVTQTDVDQVEADVGALSESCRQLKRRQQELEESVAALTKQIDKLAMDQRKTALDLKALQEKLVVVRRQIENQREKVRQSTPDPVRVKQLNSKINSATAEFEKAEAAASVVEEQVKVVHEKIMEVTGGKIKAAQKKLDDVVKSFDKVRGDIAKLGQAIKTSERNAIKSRDKIKTFEAELEEALNERQSLQSARDKLEEEASKVIAETKTLAARCTDLDQRLVGLKAELDAITSEQNEAKASKIEFDQRMEKYTVKIKECNDLTARYKRELEKLELQSVPESDRTADDVTELPQLDAQQLQLLELERVKYSINGLEEELRKLKPDLAALAEYRKKEAVFLSRVAELDEITCRRDTQRSYYDDLRKQRLNEFMSGFAIITSKLKEMYQMITLGGDAELELVDSLDPFSEGIVFSVRPPKKSWKNITNLSGGEKTLSSLALVFALHYYKPTPLYVMDEIDAALDFKNVSIVGNYIKERTKNAQFIIISLRSQMFELADRLVGIYKTHDATKSVTINPGLISQSGVSSAAPSSQPSLPQSVPV